MSRGPQKIKGTLQVCLPLSLLLLPRTNVCIDYLMQLSAFRDLKSWWNQVSHSDDSIWILGISLVWPIISSLQEDEENPTVFTISLELSDRDMSVSLRVNPVCKLRKAPQEAWLTWSCIKEVGGTYCSFSEVNFSFPEFPPLGRCSRAVQEVSAGAASLSELCLFSLHLNGNQS